MIDTGADRDVISGNMIKRLDIPMVLTELRVVTVDKELTSDRPLASFTIESLDKEYQAEVNDALVGDLLTGENDKPPSQCDLSGCRHLSGIVFDDIPGGVEMIIGAAHISAMAPTELRRGGVNDNVIGMKCLLGWTIAGVLGRSSPEEVAVNAISADNEMLRQSLDRIFYHDFAIVSESELGESKEHREAIEQLAKTIRFDEKVGKYFVGLPWNRPRRDHEAIQHFEHKTNGNEKTPWNGIQDGERSSEKRKSFCRVEEV